MEWLNKDILSGPTSAIPDPSRSFYIKTYWYKDVMGAVFLQVDVSVEIRKLKAKERTAESINLTST